MVQLAAIGVEQLVESFEFVRVAGLDAQPEAADRVEAVVEGDFQDFRQIEVTGQDIGFLTERAGFHADAGAALAGVDDRFSGVQEFLDDGVGIVKCRLSPTFAGDFAGFLHEGVRSFLADLDVGARLELLEFVHGFQNEIGYFVDAVRSVGGDATGVEVGEVGVGAAFLEGDSHFGRRRLVVEFDPEALEEFLGLFACQCSVGEFLTVKRI